MGLMYKYLLVSHTQLCVLYIVKEVMLFQGIGQLMGVMHNKMCAQALQYRPGGRKLLVAYVEIELIAVLPEIYS